MIGKNLVIIEGHMVGNVVEETTSAGLTLTHIVVSVQGDRWDNKEKKEKSVVDEIPVTLFGKSAQYAKEVAKNGDLILITGKLSSRASSDKRRFLNMFVTDFSVVKVYHGGGQPSGSASAAPAATASAPAAASAPQEDLPF